MPFSFTYDADVDLPATASVKRGSVRMSKNATYRGEMSVIINSEDNAWSPEEGHILNVLEDPGAVRIFAGPIKSVNRTLAEGTTLRVNVVTCADMSDLAHRPLAGQRVYIDQKLGDIFRDLITNAVGQGVQGTSVPAGSGPTIKKLELDYPTCAAAFDEALRVAGGGLWWIDEEKEFFYQLGTPASAAFTIDAATNWIEKGSLALETSLEGYANKLVVTGTKYELPEATESFGGAHGSQPTDGSRQSWSLTYPVGRVPVVRVNGVVKTIGIQAIDTGKDWYWSQDSREVEQDDAATPLTSADTLAVTYVGLTREEKIIENAPEVSARGIYEQHIQVTRQTTQADFDATADALLAALSQPTYILRFNVVRGDRTIKPKPGDRVDINSRSGYPDLAGLIVDSVSFVPTGEAPEELQRQVVCRKGPKIADGLDLITGGSATGATSIGGLTVVGSGGSADAVFSVSAASGTLTLNHANGTVFVVTATGDFTLGEPTGKVASKRLSVKLIPGAFTVTMGAWWGNLRNLGPAREMVADTDWSHDIHGIVDAAGTGFVFLTQDSIGPE